MGKIQHIHDKFFKEVYSHKEIAEDFIAQNLPTEILGLVDMGSLELQKDSFINKDLEENFSDIIYRVKIDNKDSYISLLLEHKSYVDKMTIFQVQKYIVEAWTAKVGKEDQSEIPIIIPLVIFHGKSNWTPKTDLRDMINGYGGLSKYVKERLPVFKHELINIRDYEEKDFEKYKKLTAFMLKAFKYSFERDADKVLKVYLLGLDELKGTVTMELISYYGNLYLDYISDVNKEIDEEFISSKIKELGGKGAIVMTLLEKKREEGKFEVVENMLLDGVDIALISKWTGLSKAEIEEIKVSMDLK